jgi:ceramide glucosyltransferase
MEMTREALGTGVAILAWLPAAYYLFASGASRRFFRPSVLDQTANDKAGFTPPVSVLKPVRGLDRHAVEHFTSFCRQEYPEYEILFGVADASDPAIPVIRQLITDCPGRSMRLIVGAQELGSSSKVNKLCRLVREARHEILVISDSDVSVTPSYLRSVAAPFRDDQVGAVTCLYRGLPDPGIWGALEAIGISTDFAPGVIVARQLEGMTFTLGATMATTKTRLAEVGGFEALVDYCADDFELGHRIAARGYRVELATCTVETESAPRSFTEFFRHQLRWAVTLRHSRPWGYVGRAIVTQGLPWALASAVLAPSPSRVAAPIAVYLLCRLSMAWIVGARGLGDGTVRRRWMLVPVYDALASVVSVAALWVNRIEWRGRRFKMRRGRLVPMDENILRNVNDRVIDDPRPSR